MFFVFSYFASMLRQLASVFRADSSDNGRNVKWLDVLSRGRGGMGKINVSLSNFGLTGIARTKTQGIRGIASVLVILTHLARAWDYDLFYSKTTEDATPRLLQQPVFRIPWQGRIGVTIFAFLTGYVCALKPLKLSRQGNHSAAFSAIAKSAFRRPPRLILPATIAMVCAWTLTQLGAYTVAKRCDSNWIRDASPRPEGSVWNELCRLWRVFMSTWTNGHMDYDDHQWALLPLLKGSMMVYVVLCGTMYVQYRYRLVVYFIMYAYFHQVNTGDAETFAQQFFFGMFLSDTAHHTPVQAFISARRWPRRILCLFLFGLGLFFASYPGDKPEWCGWSRVLQNIGSHIFPNGSNTAKRWTALGVDMLILSIYLSPRAKSFLSRRIFIFLGRNSFAVYLVHGTLLRTVLTWMLYGTVTGEPWEKIENEEGEMVDPPWLERGGPMRFATCIPAWIAIVYVTAHLWTSYVDAWCARVTMKLENKVFERGEKNGPLLPA
ncbi:hypothetical protein AJ80_00337 [Polytolypa hystricis UAMH7299]|uniref:Acyltransferase 3 domain-containing protein n=1 Tax=Polytolypa hystricis (strain UAMH7299) TaxID=1447883 RepID=A0A2B7Z3U8_POLH7|nr:hypothetical protein AJ80_00337 [Polytolypa hystricis UAMH7299]